MPHEPSKQSKIGEAVVVIILGLVLMAFVHWGFGLVVFVGLLMLFSPTDRARKMTARGSPSTPPNVQAARTADSGRAPGHGSPEDGHRTLDYPSRARQN